MPELPEVETTAVELAAEVLGRRILGVIKLDHPAMVETPDVETFKARIVGRRIEAVTRRAKWVLLRLDEDLTLAVHLRMTGILRAAPAAETPDKHTHLVLSLDDGNQIFFRDSRKFGRVKLLDAAGLAALDQAHGVEPLGEGFTPEVFADLLHGRRTKLKPLLLDQALVAGLGNIYTDEALYQAKLHPLRVAETLEGAEIGRLHAAIRDVLSRGVARKARYWDGAVRAHEDFDEFAVYDRAGEPCRVCGEAIARIVIAQRGTHFCPGCQPTPGL
jgi:formamidopyrimidine-DNA glycosylase